MRLPRLWTMGVIVGLIIVAAVVATACASSPKAAQTLMLQADTVVSSTGVKNPADICVESSQFLQGEGVVWRIKVYDPATGNPMDNSTLDSVVVSLKDGQPFTATYGGHPGQPGVPVTDYFWSTAWSIPQNYPTGSVAYTVTAKSKDGRTGTFAEFNVAPSLLMVVAAQPPVAHTLTVDANTVIGAEGVKNPADICIQSSRFPQGESVVWQIKVYDPATGNPMDNSTLDSVVVSLKDGQTFTAAYGGHPGQPGVPVTDYFWSAAWSIPATYPTGSVPYTVTAKSKDGRTGTFTEFNVAPSLLTVVAAQ